MIQELGGSENLKLIKRQRKSLYKYIGNVGLKNWVEVRFK